MNEHGDKMTLEALARTRGLRFVGGVPLQLPPGEWDRFTSWLAAGKHGEMRYLERYQDVREDPSKLLPGATHLLIFGLPYSQGDKWPAPQSAPRVAQYARLRDYHKHLKKELDKLFEEFLGPSHQQFNHRVVVDSAPLLERACAAGADAGFIGKNTCFIHPDWGSLLLLGEIVTDYPLQTGPGVSQVNPQQRTAAGGCGTCQRCQVNCPTGALDEAYQLDAKKCLSYWTIEHRGTIPEKFWPWLKHYYFGCDICQLVCPYNRGGDELVRPELRRQPPADLMAIATMDQGQYEQWFGGTPMTRAKKEGLQRNAMIALTVTEDPRVPELIASLAEATDPVVQGTIAQMKKWLQSNC